MKWCSILFHSRSFGRMKCFLVPPSVELIFRIRSASSVCTSGMHWQLTKMRQQGGGDRGTWNGSIKPPFYKNIILRSCICQGAFWGDRNGPNIFEKRNGLRDPYDMYVYTCTRCTYIFLYIYIITYIYIDLTTYTHIWLDIGMNLRFSPKNLLLGFLIQP